jgi:hypothetical protein
MDKDTAEYWAEHQMAGILELSGINEDLELPEPHTPDRVVQDASKFRQFLATECTMTTCAVCSMRCRSVDVATYAFADVPNVHLLLVEGEKTEQLPRDALTRFDFKGVEYCMQKEACTVSIDGQHCQVDICCHCYKDLNNKKTPRQSLVSFDTGEMQKIMMSVL